MRAVGRAPHGTWSENDVELAVDVVEAAHPIQQPLGVAEGEARPRLP